MSRHLVLSFRFLSPSYHGRGDEGVPEWPPSPLRAFQAVVAAAARAGILADARSSLAWLERCPPPRIIASQATTSRAGYRLSVPHNGLDLAGPYWAKGTVEALARAQRVLDENQTMKAVRPHLLPEDAVVHYVWELPDNAPDVAPLLAAARSVVALGWGIDLVAGHGELADSARLAEVSASLRVWEPRADGTSGLRTPRAGTLDDLDRRHEAFLSRVSLDSPTLSPPPPLTAFDVTRYAWVGQPASVDVAAFSLMHVDADRFRAFDPVRRGMVVAGMLRDAARRAAVRNGWDDDRVRSVVLGHGEAGNPRLLLVPLPSIEPRGPGAETVSAVRRVMLFSTDVRGLETEWARRALGGLDLVDERTGEVQAVLSAVARDDRVVKRYVEASRSWATVTPVVLPGHDDPGGLVARLRETRDADEQRQLLERLARRREGLVRKALRHAGFSDELAFRAKVETREVGFIAGVDKAARYAVPQHLADSPRLHVKLTWPEKVPGPICIGRGRYSGLGLLAPVAD